MLQIRVTENVAAIFNAMLERPNKSWYGLELANHAEIGSATIYAALRRLARAGCIEATWEDVDPAIAGRPRRRLYRLTREGSEFGHQALTSYRPRVRPSRIWPGPQPERLLS